MKLGSSTVIVFALLFSGVVTGQVANPAKYPEEEKLWEPWVDTAVIGDRVIRNYSAKGYREFLEVTAIDEENVTVTVKRTDSRGARKGRGDEVRRLVYSRKKYPALEKFYAEAKLAAQAKVPVEFKSKRFRCRGRRGRVITRFSITAEGIAIDKTLRCKDAVHADIPLGGVAKRVLEVEAPGDRKSDERHWPGQLEFVLEDFARGGSPGPSMKEFGKKKRGLVYCTNPLTPAEQNALATLCSTTKGQVGWRGDGTGRFPKADPPLHWGRISKTMKGLRTQATRPKGDGPGNAKPIRYGTVEDWLVLGPVPTGEERVRTLLKKDILPDEAQFRPDAGEKVGKLTWRPIHVEGSLLHLNRILPDARNLKGNAVYAHTYLYAPRANWVFMRVRGPMKTPALVKMLVNGKGLGKPCGKGTWRVQLKQGWNRILARTLATEKKASVNNDPHPEGSLTFNFELYGAEKDETYEETNILWTAALPQAGTPTWYDPIIVGDRIYAASSPAFLVCYDKMTGKRLWTRYHGFEEFITDAERKAFPDLCAQIDLKAKRFRTVGESYSGSLDEFLELDRLHRELKDLLKKVDRVKYAHPRTQEPGYAAQPLSDGKYIYTWSYLGIAACYDLEGNRRWMTLENEGPRVKHGYSLAPVLVGGDFVVKMQNTIGFDRATGQVNWKIPGSGALYSTSGKPMTSAETDAVNYEGIGIYKPGFGFFPWSTVTREGSELWRVRKTQSMGFRYRLPEDADKAPVFEEIEVKPWYRPGDRLYLPGVYRGTILVLGCPLFHDGLAYTVTMGGVLRVQELESNKPVYLKLLDLNSVTWSYPYPHGGGCAASPTMAGNYVYLLGGNGTTLVIKPGRTYERVAKNHIERLVPGKLAGIYPKIPKDPVTDRYPECTVSSPIFNGHRLYYRAERYLYCIGEN